MAKNGSNRWIWILAIVTVLIIVIAALGKNMGWYGNSEGIEVTTKRVEYGSIVELVSSSGKIQPETEVKISSEVSGEIVALNINEGDSVKKGDYLLRLRPDNFEAAVDQSEATLKSSIANYAQAKARILQSEALVNRNKIEYERSKKLHQDKVISDFDLLQAKTTFESSKADLAAAEESAKAANFSVANARAALKNAKENLSLTKIYAPREGIISKLSVELGERVLGTIQMAGTELMIIANLDTMEVLVDVNETDIVKVNVGDTANIEVDAYSDRKTPFKGIVTEIANTAKASISEESVTEFEVKVRILRSSYQDLMTKTPYPFRPGMTASVDIITESKNRVLTVPLSAVTTREKESKESSGSNNDEINNIDEVIFLYKEGRAKKKIVKTGIADFDKIEIVEGLNIDDEIISGPYSVVTARLRDSLAVERGEKPSNSFNSK